MTLADVVNTLLIPPGIFRPNEGSIALAETALEYNGKFLELGTGSGFITIVLYQQGKRGEATDISDRALRCARGNFARYKVQARLFKSDLYQEVERTYDTIIFNPPTSFNEDENERVIKNIIKSLFPSLISRYISAFYQWRNSPAREAALLDFIRITKDYLTKGGRLLLCVLNADAIYLEENAPHYVRISRGRNTIDNTLLTVTYR